MDETLGFTTDLSTTAVEIESLKNTSIGLDILWRASVLDPETDAPVYRIQTVFYHGIDNGHTDSGSHHSTDKRKCR
jgi:hypothetical protein